ncbi:hypothetical protein BS47DRAFT_453409 [Hydnum rufescens UP504]|uniref:CCHC-type domain-containing protein n=1 Tax=Hydnum rufescens UP504 TaxID=1448309 RepID=A0A9P6AIP4_9AGAM|nr:hypothetical protein BS47DRAFT_453409 [Hydnum rufescens UP504]
MKQSPVFGGAVATTFGSWFLKLQEHMNWYNARFWAALVHFDPKWCLCWFVDPVLTRLDISMFEDMHKPKAFVNEQYSLEGEWRCDGAVALALRDVSRGRSSHSQILYRRRDDRSHCPHTLVPEIILASLAIRTASCPFQAASICIVCGAPGHKATSCKATSTNLRKQAVTVSDRSAIGPLLTVTPRFFSSRVYSHNDDV